MPKIYLTEQEKLNNELSAWLIGTMKIRGIKQEEAAKALGITQQALSLKLRSKSFKYEDLVCLFGILQPDAQTIANLMGEKVWKTRG